MIKKYITFTLFIMWIVPAGAQTTWFHFDHSTKVSLDSRVLQNPWAGGLNSSQFSKMHLNDDAVEDLVVFDRTTNKVSCFLGDGVTKTFRYAPAYEARFPVMLNWMLLVDFNGDGHKDLFTYTNLGITAYRQTPEGSSWTWKQVKPYLTSLGQNGRELNLLVNGTDIPALTDLDDDGDLDIIAFEIEGDYAELHQNMSMEKYGVPDSLVFVRNGACWGNFYKHSCQEFHFGEDCQVQETPELRVAQPTNTLHSGNAILVSDITGDGLKDLLLGFVSCDNISLLENKGGKLAANFTSVIQNFPVSNPVAFDFFPAVYLEDVDFDGKKDLLASPNTSGNDGNLMEFRTSNWYYHNAGTNSLPNFQLRKKDFLQDEMIDVGEHAAPSFFDVNGDGKIDMIIGTGGVRDDTGFKGSLWFLKNTGTNQSPEFNIESKDFLALSKSHTLTRLQPQWADFDGDGIPDLGIASTGSGGLEFRYFSNKGKKNEAVSFDLSKPINIPLPTITRVTDKIHFFDIDKDGDLDLIIGRSEGNLVSYRNVGTAKNPSYTLETDALGGVSFNFSGRYVSLAVADVNLDGRPDLLTCDYSGKVKIFHSGPWGAWTKRDSIIIKNDLQDLPFSPSLGNFQQVSLGDYNGDGKPDLAVGTYAGGVYLFSNQLDIPITGLEPTDPPRVNIFPNPATHQVNIIALQDASLEIFDITGRSMLPRPGVLKSGVDLPVKTSHWNAGVYFIRVSNAYGQVTKKIIIYR